MSAAWAIDADDNGQFMRRHLLHEIYLANVTILVTFFAVGGLMWVYSPLAETSAAAHPAVKSAVKEVVKVEKVIQKVIDPSISPVVIKLDIPGGEPASQLTAEMQKSFKDKKFDLLSDLAVRTSSSGATVVSFTAGKVFLPGQTDLSPEAEKDMEVVAQVLSRYKDRYEIAIVGYTDSQPPTKSKWRFPTNWELSANRAGRLVRYLEGRGFPSRNLVLVGYGDSRPKINDRTPSGEIDADKAVNNRRVEIRLRPRVE